MKKYNIKKLVHRTNVLKERDIEKIIKIIDLVYKDNDAFFSRSKSERERDKYSNQYDSLDEQKCYKNKLIRMINILEDSHISDMQRKINISDSLANLFCLFELIKSMSDEEYVKYESDIYIDLNVLLIAYKGYLNLAYIKQNLRDS